jgi:hypothetical protein
MAKQARKVVAHEIQSVTELGDYSLVATRAGMYVVGAGRYEAFTHFDPREAIAKVSSIDEAERVLRRINR